MACADRAKLAHRGRRIQGLTLFNTVEHVAHGKYLLDCTERVQDSDSVQYFVTNALVMIVLVSDQFFPSGEERIAWSEVAGVRRWKMEARTSVISGRTKEPTQLVNGRVAMAHLAAPAVAALGQAAPEPADSPSSLVDKQPHATSTSRVVSCRGQE